MVYYNKHSCILCNWYAWELRIEEAEVQQSLVLAVVGSQIHMLIEIAIVTVN